MGVDINFYKKDYVELTDYFHTRDKDLLYFIRTFKQYGDEEYGKYIRLTKKDINKIIKYMSKKDNYGAYNQMIAELMKAKENNEIVYVCADW